MNYDVLDAAAWERMGEELVLPIKELVDYEGFKRKLFHVEGVPATRATEAKVKGWSFAEITGMAIANTRAMSKAHLGEPRNAEAAWAAGSAGYFIEWPTGEVVAADAPAPQQGLGPGIKLAPGEFLPPGAVWGYTEPEYLGEQTIRVELFSEPYRPIR